jgi:hypothetical protein
LTANPFVAVRAACWRRDDQGAAASLAENQNVKGVMKRQGSTPAKTAGKLSDAILATRYLDLQRLRDKVRKAEARFASASLQKVSISRLPPRSDPARRN